MIFTYSGFRSFLDAMNALGPTRRFGDWKGEAAFLLRHDVDLDLELAHRLAGIEREKDVVATYFVLTSCATYNVLSADNRRLLGEIAAMGHEIGLHFDPTLYPADLDAAVTREAEVLAFASGQPIRSVSLHNPSLHGQYPLFDGFVNAYDPALFSDENYLSDSRFSFRGKDPLAFLERIANGMVQILLHPMHYSEDGDGYDKVIPGLVARSVEEVHRQFSVNATYREQVGEDLVAVVKKSLP